MLACELQREVSPPLAGGMPRAMVYVEHFLQGFGGDCCLGSKLCHGYRICAAAGLRQDLAKISECRMFVKQHVPQKLGAAR